MAIAIRSTNGLTSADASGVSTDLTITLGSAVVATDALVLFVGVNNATTASTYAAPAGWTQILASVTSTKVRLYGWVAYGNIANLTFTRTAGVGSEGRGYVCQAFTGVDQTTIIDVAGATSSNTGANSLTMAPFTTVTDKALPIYGAVDWNGAHVFSATSHTAVMNAAANCQTGFVYRNTTLTPAGTTGSVTVNDSAAASGNILCMMSFALRPAASGAAFLAPLPVMVKQAVKRASCYRAWPLNPPARKPSDREVRPYDGRDLTALLKARQQLNLAA